MSIARIVLWEAVLAMFRHRDPSFTGSQYGGIWYPLLDSFRTGA